MDAQSKQELKEAIEEFQTKVAAIARRVTLNALDLAFNINVHLHTVEPVVEKETKKLARQVKKQTKKALKRVKKATKQDREDAKADARRAWRIRQKLRGGMDVSALRQDERTFIEKYEKEHPTS